MALEKEQQQWGRLNGCLLVVMVGMIFYCSWLNNKIVTRSYRLNELRQDEKKLVEERDKLQAELATLKRPQNLARLARALGLQEPLPGHKVVLP
ncbi:MAG: hypothetical protein JXR80_10615 [Deltaproteobacteria bacterium]|nr:hypothetical protein [Deltaproteobacteria bacterium]